MQSVNKFLPPKHKCPQTIISGVIFTRRVGPRSRYVAATALQNKAEQTRDEVLQAEGWPRGPHRIREPGQTRANTSKAQLISLTDSTHPGAGPSRFSHGAEEPPKDCASAVRNKMGDSQRAQSTVTRAGRKGGEHLDWNLGTQMGLGSKKEGRKLVLLQRKNRISAQNRVRPNKYFTCKTIHLDPEWDYGSKTWVHE